MKDIVVHDGEHSVVILPEDMGCMALTGTTACLGSCISRHLDSIPDWRVKKIVTKWKMLTTATVMAMAGVTTYGLYSFNRDLAKMNATNHNQAENIRTLRWR